ncbi:hypothetical protein MMC18_009649, partial [Xylographa bjoerkii]|nr:hypothetical protein [Xylographa bjoerkii]
GELTGELAIYKRHDPNYRPFTLFAFAQPVPAYIGLLGSVLVVLVFTSSTWWDGPVTFGKVAIAYAAPMVLLSMWVAAKIIGRRPWVKLDEDITKLSRVLNDLQWLKPEQIQVQDMPLATLDREAGCSSRPEHHGSDQISEAPSHFLKPTT